MNKSVTVAIPAFNEEKNIVRLLNSVVIQKKSNYDLDQICVYSDGSTDSTSKLVKTNFDDIKVYDFQENIGKNKRVNQIMEDNESDILIQLDADVHLLDDDVFDELVKPIVNDEADLVCAYHVANTPENFVGKLSYFGYSIWESARKSLGEEGIRYYCEGGLRAFSYELTQSLRIPVDRHMGEDSYSFYYAVENGFRVKICKNAKVYIDLADNYQDYVRQMRRFLLEPRLMNDSFDKELTEKYETLTTRVKLKSFFLQILRSPFMGFAYLALQSTTKIRSYFYKPPVIWDPIRRK